jgi:hypothetical protein
MAGVIPLGKTESHKLEFKGRDARPLDIVREVVAFLNAAGGEIWWGIKAESDRATAEEPFPDGEARKRDLQNHLIDTIEPSPRIPGEVALELVPAQGDGFVMRIRVRQLDPGRAPAAQLKNQGRRFWIRVGNRVRVMSREEIAAQFTTAREGPSRELQALLEDRTIVEQSERPCFWMKIQPLPGIPDGEFNLQDSALGELLTNPGATGNRNSGWNFVLELSRPRLGRGGLRNETDRDNYVEIKRSGAVVFRTRLERLENPGRDRPRELLSYPVVEFPISVLRLAAKIIESWGPKVREVFVDFAFVGLRGWSLPWRSPLSPSSRFHVPKRFEEDNLVPPQPFRFTRDELVQEPDRCGLRLITFIYEAFGYPADAIPPEFDQRIGTLTILPI